MKNHENIDRTYRYWRLHIMLAYVCGYAGFYLTHKSFNYAVPALITDLGIDKNDIGMMATLFYITYGLSKFFSDFFPIELIHGILWHGGLLITGVINILLGYPTQS